MHLRDFLAGLVGDGTQENRMEGLQDGGGPMRVQGGEAPAAVRDGEENEVRQFPLGCVLVLKGLEIDDLADVLFQPMLFDDAEGQIGQFLARFFEGQLWHWITELRSCPAGSDPS